MRNRFRRTFCKTFMELKVHLHRQWFLCLSVLSNTVWHTVTISSKLAAWRRAKPSDTKITVRVNRPLVP
jgi:hypothetical protein